MDHQQHDTSSTVVQYRSRVKRYNTEVQYSTAVQYRGRVIQCRSTYKTAVKQYKSSLENSTAIQYSKTVQYIIQYNSTVQYSTGIQYGVLQILQNTALKTLEAASLATNDNPDEGD